MQKYIKKYIIVLIMCSDSYFYLSVSLRFSFIFLLECIWNCYMQVTHSSGDNRQVDVSINNGEGYLDLFELEVKLRVITVNKTPNLIVVIKHRIFMSLTWKSHIRNLLIKLSRISGILHSLRNMFPVVILQKLYVSLVCPQLTYGLLAWSHQCLM